ncbi:YecA family protein [Erwinia persicina]|uniref:YecA/YgfB family protein n=1 Tax=Erwinia persicina TaxID=55211 RepID=UPI0021056EB2|nr:YecA family protein [Erwinia persicina]MCQ4107172.1 YecA family protein [Erwinia persicina]UTX13676.1 YecA family protein [Erwinia persicina]
MSLTNIMPGYNTLASVLTQQGVGMTPAEMHGLISGLICGGNHDSSWQTLMHDLTNEGMAFSQTLAQPLQEMYEAIGNTLEDEGFLFQLYLPEDDDITVFDRADALAGWVNHFLLGLGVVQPKIGQVKGETGEAIDDLRTIAQLGYDEDEDQEELEQSLEEVIEYVRVAALLCHDTFTRAVPTNVVMKKPTLH